MKNESNRILYFLLVVIQLLFGINFSISKIILKKIDPFLWSNIRFLIAGFVLLIITLILKRKHPPMEKKFFLSVIPLGLLGMGLGQGLFLFGLNFTTSINTAVISTSIPILTILCVTLLGLEKANTAKAIGFIISLAGVLGLRKIEEFSISSQNLIGDISVLGGCLSFAIYLTFAKKFLNKYDNLWSTTYMFFVSAISMIGFNIHKINIIQNLDLNYLDYICIFYSILGATVLTYFLNNYVLKRIPSSNVSLFIYIQPVVAFIFGHYFLGEKIGMRIIICSFLIFQGIFISNLKIFGQRKFDSD